MTSDTEEMGLCRDFTGGLCLACLRGTLHPYHPEGVPHGTYRDLLTCTKCDAVFLRRAIFLEKVKKMTHKQKLEKILKWAEAMRENDSTYSTYAEHLDLVLDALPTAIERAEPSPGDRVMACDEPQGTLAVHRGESVVIWDNGEWSTEIISSLVFATGQGD